MPALPAHELRRLARWPLLAVVLLLLTGGLLLWPPAAQAQTQPPATFDQHGVLTTPQGTAFIDGLSINRERCIEFDADAVSYRIFNNAYPFIAICMENRSRGGGGNFRFLFPESLASHAFSLPHHDYRIRVDILNDQGTSVSAASLGLRTDFTLSRAISLNGKMYAFSPGLSPGYISGNSNSVSAGDTISFRITMVSGISEYASTTDVDIPAAPETGTSARSSDGAEATINWDIFTPVVEYQIEREQATTIAAMSTVTTQYVNTTRFLVPGTVWGLDSYTDATVEAEFTYRYRVRARRGAAKWGAWSGYVVSAGQSSTDIQAPGRLQAVRARDNSHVALSWTAPSGEIDGFAVQRQELVLAEGSTIFANPVVLAEQLSPETLTYTDASILPGRTYEYRVAALAGGVPGQPTEWARVSPFTRLFGTAPQNLRLVEDDTARVLDDRREFWMRWDEVQGADDYDVEVRVYDSAGDRTLERYVYTAPTYFETAYGRVELRTRGRMADDALCGDGDGTLETGEDCHTQWTGWYGVGFVPKLAPGPVPTALPDPSIDELQADVDELVNALDETGVDVDPSVAVQFAVLVGTVVVSMTSIVVGWRRGMKPLGVGMAFSAAVISLYLGHVLLGIPAAWPIGAQALIVIPGLVAFARQVGAFR